MFYVDDVVRTRYLDAAIGAVQSSLDATFSDAGVVRPTSWSTDRKSFIVATSGPKDPGSFYFYDPVKNHASLVGRAAPKIPASELGEMLIINYKSRDGTKLPGYLTLPPGKGDKKLPLEVWEIMCETHPERDRESLRAWVIKFFRLWSRNQWKRERYAPCFHVDDKNLDPKTWCRFPILSSGFRDELAELERA